MSEMQALITKCLVRLSMTIDKEQSNCLGQWFSMMCITTLLPPTGEPYTLNFIFLLQPSTNSDMPKSFRWNTELDTVEK